MEHNTEQMAEKEGKVTYLKIFGTFILICGLFMLFSSFVLTGSAINTVTGAVLCLFSILYMTTPVFTYNDLGFEKKNLFGMTLKSYTFTKDKITVQNKNIYVNDKKVRISKGMLVKREYEQFVNHLETKGGGERNNRKSVRPKSDSSILDADMIGSQKS